MHSCLGFLSLHLQWHCEILYNFELPVLCILESRSSFSFSAPSFLLPPLRPLSLVLVLGRVSSVSKRSRDPLVVISWHLSSSCSSSFLSSTADLSAINHLSTLYPYFVCRSWLLFLHRHNILTSCDDCFLLSFCFLFPASRFLLPVSSWPSTSFLGHSWPLSYLTCSTTSFLFSRPYSHLSSKVSSLATMNRHYHSPSIYSLSDEEKMGLLDNRSISDADSESGRDDHDFRPHNEKWAGPILAPVDYIRSTPWRVYLVRFAWFFVPSYLQGRHAREQIRPAKLAPTAYLDGMRGVAALVVLFCHFFYQAFVIAKGWGCDDAHYNILKLPILRLWYQGPPAVCLFFVISGYALSYRPLKLIRSRNLQDFSTTMSSLVFRRGIRLYLPTAISTLMIVSFIRLGVYEQTREFAMDRTFMRNIREPHPSPLPTLYAQLADWAKDMFNFVHVFGWKTHGGSTNYDQHLWTIPVEFRCSLYLFLTLIATARLRTQYRFITVAGVMLFTYRNSRWEFLMFLCGMILAEIDLARGAHSSPPALPIEEKTQSSRPRWYQSAFWATLSIAGLYLMSQPDEGGDRTPGWVYLTSLIPQWWAAEKYRYWQCTGAVMFVLAVSRSSNWQRVFNSAFIQYLGKISYALYLMHGPIIHAFGYHIERWAYSLTGTEGHQFTAGFVLSSFFVIPTIFWCADVFWRAVDIPTVKFAKWWENKLTVKAD